MQKKVREFNEANRVYDEEMPVSARMLDIISEMGELNKEYLKSSNYGTKKFTLTKDFELEFGDCMYSLMCLANEVGLDADKSLDKVIAKYKERISKNNRLDSGN